MDNYLMAFCMTVGSELAELTRSVLDCPRVGMHTADLKTQILRPLAVVGLNAEQERMWWGQPNQEEMHVSKLLPASHLAALQRNEVLILDMRHQEFSQQPNPYGIQTILLVPMSIGECMTGILTLDYGPVPHIYQANELALASAIGKFAALIIERPRLLTEHAEAQGRIVALHEANNRMEEFLGIASRELRTPLTTIKANTQLAMRRLKSVLQQPEFLLAGTEQKVEASLGMLERAERQVGVLNRLVNDMLDISCIQAGKLQLHVRTEPCNLIKIVEEAVQEQRKATPERSINVDLPASRQISVVADPDRIGQVIANYLTNALKYSEFDRPVSVQVRLETQEHVRVNVRDQGIGITAEEQQFVWECLYQSPNIKVLSGSGVGLGLGLHISQTLIERHGGHVGVTSAQNAGSEFWFTLPLAQAQY